MVGNYQSVAKLYEWIDVKGESDKIQLRKRNNKNELTNNLSQSSLVACNDFNFILSLFDAENKIDNDEIISKFKYIYKQKPELSSLGNDSLLFRLEINSEKQLFDFLIEQDLSKRQLVILYERFISSGDRYPAGELSDFVNKLLKKNNRFSRWKIKLINYLYNRITLPSSELSFLYEHLERILHEFEYDDESFGSSDMVEYITLINNINERFQAIWDNRRFYKVLFHNIERVSRQNLSVRIEFIKAINKSNNLKSIYHTFPPGFFDDIFDRLCSDCFDSGNKNYISDCLILISELNNDFILRNDRFMKSFKNLSCHSYIEYFPSENPNFALKYIMIIRIPSYCKFSI
ncbi:hypothetical protein EZS27_035166 [termite gut metagenome]|uniref:Uncharacterized protein n=1 Tax=termite gut metagenome TaxID=433724 RepID=A0A5J4PZR2_9ZZZZ